MNNINDKIEKKCEVCNNSILVDELYQQGDCPFCGWHNCFLNEVNPDSVALPNLFSLNRAKQLYNEGKPFEPNLNDFINALHSYGEMQFEYSGIYYAVELIDDKNKETKIRLYNSQTKQTQFFDTDEEFIENAKIEDKFLKDIWEKTTDRYWLQ